jgi:hypothetical protein
VFGSTTEESPKSSGADTIKTPVLAVKFHRGETLRGSGIDKEDKKSNEASFN